MWVCVCLEPFTLLRLPSSAALARARSSLHPLSISLVQLGLSLPLSYPSLSRDVDLYSLFRRVFLLHSEYQLFYPFPPTPRALSVIRKCRKPRYRCVLATYKYLCTCCALLAIFLIRNNESSCCFLVLSLFLSPCPFLALCVLSTCLAFASAFARSFGPHLNLFLHHRALQHLSSLQDRSNFIPPPRARVALSSPRKQPVPPFYLLRVYIVHRTSR